MRMQLLIAATLAACSCADSSGCPETVPEGDPHTFDLDLDGTTVQDLLEQRGLSDPDKLVCEEVCEAVYFEAAGNGFQFTRIDTCVLTIDDEWMGKTEGIVGSLHCEGLHSDYVCTGGRRPLGHIEHTLADAGLPAYLAHCARLEAASVLAFEQLAERLALWQAPADLIARCHQAAREESTHAELIADLARSAGATVEPATYHAVPVDLAAAALDNAVEGCVLEAWSALTCAVTGRHAATPELRAVYTRLATDEAAHAQLAWDLHTWFMGQVSRDQRTTIERVQHTALAALPALAVAQARRVPPALAFPHPCAAANFAAALARTA